MADENNHSILVIDDSEEQRGFITETFALSRYSISIKWLKQCSALWNELNHETKPKLILIHSKTLAADTNHECFLGTLRSDSRSKSIPTIFYHHGVPPNSIAFSKLRSHSCINKTNSYRKFVSILDKTCRYWLDMSYRFPSPDVCSDTILFVENESNQVYLSELAMRDIGYAGQVDFVEDGIEALDYLNQKGKYSSITKLPGLIMLDLRMNRLDGIEFLRRIESDASLNTIPVVTLSYATNKKDVNFIYQLGAYSLIPFPPFKDTRRDVILQTLEYWLGTVELPNA